MLTEQKFLGLKINKDLIFQSHTKLITKSGSQKLSTLNHSDHIFLIDLTRSLEVNSITVH